MKSIALMFAVNSYPGSPLNGCLNDQADYVWKWDEQGLPVDKNCFTEKDVTNTRILGEIKKLGQSLKPTRIGEYCVVICYSGHGSYMKTGKEADGFSECLYPYNGIPVFDYEMKEALNYFDERVLVIVRLDSCFSGGMARLFGTGVKERFIRVVPQVPDQMHKIHRPFMRDMATNFVMISGSGERQTCADAYFGQRPNGAYSYFDIKEWKYGKTIRQQFNEVRRHLPSNEFAQIPQLMGNEAWFDWPDFGAGDKRKWYHFMCS